MTVEWVRRVSIGQNATAQKYPTASSSLFRVISPCVSFKLSSASPSLSLTRSGCVPFSRFVDPPRVRLIDPSLRPRSIESLATFNFREGACSSRPHSPTCPLLEDILRLIRRACASMETRCSRLSTRCRLAQHRAQPSAARRRLITLKMGLMTMTLMTAMVRGGQLG